MITKKKALFNKTSHFFHLDGLVTFLYQLAFKIVRRQIKYRFPKVQDLWCRNSVALGYLEPFVSDLDLTLVLQSRDLKYEQEILKFLKIFSKIFPFLGEVNIIAEEDFPLLAEILNPFELERDPYLQKRLHAPKTSIDRALQGVFLLKMLESNYKDLEAHSSLRRKKWAFHFQQLGRSQPFPNEDLRRSILRQICDDLNVPSDHLESALDKLTSGRPLHLVFDTEMPPPLYAMLFNHLCFLAPSDANWTPQARDILMAVLKWEVWGLYTQLSQIPQEDLVRHLARLRERSSVLLDKTQNDLAVNYLLFLSKKLEVE